jgi:hypothetical protein
VAGLLVVWKTKTDYEGAEFGPVWVVDADDPDVHIEEFDEWMSRADAERLARLLGVEFNEG